MRSFQKIRYSVTHNLGHIGVPQIILGYSKARYFRLLNFQYCQKYQLFIETYNKQKLTMKKCSLSRSNILKSLSNDTLMSSVEAKVNFKLYENRKQTHI